MTHDELARKIVADCTEECADHSVSVHVARLTTAIAAALKARGVPEGLPVTIDGKPIVPGMTIWRIGDLWLDEDATPKEPFDCGITVTSVRMVPNARRDGFKWRIAIEGAPDLYDPNFLYSSWDALRAGTESAESARDGGTKA